MITFDSEKYLEDSIYEAMESGKNPINDSYVQYCARQVELGGYGIVDLITINATPKYNDVKEHLVITLIELKNERFKADNLSQISRYRRGLCRAIDAGAFGDRDVEVECILLFKSSFPDESSWPYLIQECNWLDAYQFYFSFEDGLNFECISGYNRKTERLGVIQKSIFDVLGVKRCTTTSET